MAQDPFAAFRTRTSPPQMNPLPEEEDPFAQFRAAPMQPQMPPQPPPREPYQSILKPIQEAKQEYPTAFNQPGFINKITQPLTDFNRRQVPAAIQNVEGLKQKIQQENLPESMFYDAEQGLGNVGMSPGAIQFGGETADALSSPVNIASMLFSGGTSLAARLGLGQTANILNMGQKAAGLGTTLAGQKHMRESESWPQFGMGLLETLGGILGMRAKVPAIGKIADDIPLPTTAPKDIQLPTELPTELPAPEPGSWRYPQNQWGTINPAGQASPEVINRLLGELPIPPEQMPLVLNRIAQLQKADPEVEIGPIVNRAMLEVSRASRGEPIRGIPRPSTPPIPEHQAALDAVEARLMTRGSPSNLPPALATPQIGNVSKATEPALSPFSADVLGEPTGTNLARQQVEAAARNTPQYRQGLAVDTAIALAKQSQDPNAFSKILTQIRELPVEVLEDMKAGRPTPRNSIANVTEISPEIEAGQSLPWEMAKKGRKTQPVVGTPIPASASRPPGAFPPKPSTPSQPLGAQPAAPTGPPKPRVKSIGNGEFIPEGFPDVVLDSQGRVKRTLSGNPVRLPEEVERSLAAEVLNVPRAIQASMDLSFPFRQGLGLIHTRGWWSAWGDMVKAFGSEKAFNATMDSIRQRELFRPRAMTDLKGQWAKDPLGMKLKPSFAEESGLALADRLTIREHEYMSQLAEKIPGLGRIVKASNRGYTAFANKLRADVFEKLVDDFGRAGIDVTKDKNLAEQLASFVNNASGRGNLGEWGERHAAGLNAAFFSPRLMSSRVQMLGRGSAAAVREGFDLVRNPAAYAMAPPNVRKEYVKSMLALATAWTTMASFAKGAGAQVSMDRSNPDFGKMKFGNTRMDPAGGFQQWIVLANRLASGRHVKSTKPDEDLFYSEAKGPYDPTRLSTLYEFGKNKTSPLLSYAIDLLGAKHGQNFDTLDRTTRLAVPIIAQDLAEILNEGNYEELATLPLEAVGIGTQTYGLDDMNRRVLPGNWGEEYSFPAPKKNPWQR